MTPKFASLVAIRLVLRMCLSELSRYVPASVCTHRSPPCARVVLAEANVCEIAKQVIVMRKDLGMRKGKMVAQGAHASLRVVLQTGALDGDRFTLSVTEPMAAWLTGRFTKVCVGVESEAALDAVVARAAAPACPAR